MDRWVVAEWANARTKAHLLRPERLVWALCWTNLGNSVTADDGRPRCKRCLAAEKRARKEGAK